MKSFSSFLFQVTDLEEVKLGQNGCVLLSQTQPQEAKS